MEEVTIHAQVGRHLNIVNLLGMTLSGDLQILLEYSPFGSLLNYLRDSRETFEDEALFTAAQYSCTQETTVEVLKDGAVVNCNVRKSEKLEELASFSYQIARGMEYLTHHDIIHRDLATRNVLVYENKVVKICDFGLSKQRSEYYRMVDSKNIRLPVKWMAPESLQEKLYSEKSDVWSFGIVVWEIFTFGESPYSAEMKDDCCQIDSWVAVLKAGLRLSKPSACPGNIYHQSVNASFDYNYVLAVMLSATDVISFVVMAKGADSLDSTSLVTTDLFVDTLYQ
ncbi:platelet-derived growth factor receptor alpha-like [Paramacrobiotus metropolitanus]|uniref:platelet-derived growth factor receptor alpha-like n=1 Tax=Paramacrobiotus metropolitanus TaxID=2943436 RepID=UPI002445CCD1|nr:platelet-derived growth factor receptor alpha-like [Paramacrobiotus metropolitanus]